MNQFLEDVLKGLNAPDKHLDSKYFYNSKGDALFQNIMHCPEYYPTRCELEIFTQQASGLVKTFTQKFKEFDIVELGAGDASKSSYLLKELVNQKVPFTYYPIDISNNVINFLQSELPKRIPGLHLHGLNGEYFSMLNKAKTLSNKIKVVLFMGGNIGNIPINKAGGFCKSMRDNLVPGDLLLIGFDLIKHPQLILDAYNDKQGFTKQFNLNLLQRINDELNGDFIINNFHHFPTYDPQTAACKSYLISTQQQQVHIAGNLISFKENEPIFMEIAQKYTVQQTDELAKQAGFMPVAKFFDSKKWFLDALWQCI